MPEEEVFAEKRSKPPDDYEQEWMNDWDLKELETVIEELCLSKAEELRMLGYDQVTSSDVWLCVSSAYRKSGQPSLHALVSDILSLKATKFMNYLTLSAYKGTQF